MFTRIRSRILAAQAGVLLVGFGLLDLVLVALRVSDTAVLVGVTGGVALLSLGLAAVVATRVARTTTQPLLELGAAIERLADGGDAELVPTDNGRDEVSGLRRTFQSSAARLRADMRDLEAGRAQLATLVSYMADGLIIVDDDEIVEFVNPAAVRLLDVPAPSLMGRSAAAALRDHELVAVVREALLGASPTPRLIDLGPGDHRRTVQVVASPLRDPPGAGRRALVLLQDVTELRRTETVRREFVANVSHELRTPVAALKALAETLEDGALDDPPAARDFVHRMLIEVDGLAQLVEELFELSRIESGRLPLQFAPIDLSATARRGAERLRPQAERAGVALHIAADDPAATVAADAERIEQVVVNLVHNAVKFTPTGGTIWVGTQVTDDEVVVSVTDTGVGIPPEAVSRLFERFYKVDRARASGGTGLGLAIVKHLVQAHGGRIWAASAGEGRGATIAFGLPRHRVAG